MVRAAAAILAVGAMCGAAAAAEPGASPGMAEALDDLRATAVVLPAQDVVDSKWNFTARAWLWAPEANMDAELNGSSAHLESDFGDAYYLGARVEFSGDTFGFLFEIETAGMESDDLAADYDFDRMRADLGVLFHLIGDGGDGFDLTLSGGARYQGTFQDAGVDDDNAWWEPFVGAEARVPVVILDLVGRATLSGFDVGPTKLQADLSVAVEFSIGPLLAEIGLRYQDLHFTTSSGGGYSMDAQSFGPYIAAGIDF